jgi:hypothetical protein
MLLLVHIVLGIMRPEAVRINLQHLLVNVKTAPVLEKQTLPMKQVRMNVQYFEKSAVVS